MTEPIADLVVIPRQPDPTQLALAREHLRRLGDFPRWPQAADPGFLVEMGEHLFGLAFPTPADVRRFVQALAPAAAAGDDREGVLRIWLRADDPESAMLPWEYLCLPEKVVQMCRRRGLAIQKNDPETGLPEKRTFLALHPRVSLVRLAADELPPAKEALELRGPLRLLIVWADPGARKGPWPGLGDLGGEVAAVVRELHGLGVHYATVRPLAHASRQELEQAVRDWQPHVLHFAGHGGFPGPGAPADLADPAIVLERKDGDDGPAHDYMTAGALRGLCVAGGVQVVVLNACSGAQSGPGLPGIAQALAGALGTGVPVVVAHQLPIPPVAATRFAWRFYKTLTLPAPVEEGVQAFRAASVAEHPFGCGAPHWGIPVVFLSVGDSNLFRDERLDLYPVPFEKVFQEHTPIVGRQFLRERFEVFKQQREREQAGGVFLLVAHPGVGKTAFLAQWAAGDREVVHFFFRATGATDPDACVKSLVHALLAKHRMIKEKPPEKEGELRQYLRALLAKVSRENWCSADKPEVILLDALDEAGRTAVDRRSVLEVLPSELPPHVYLFASCRPGPVADGLAAQCPGERCDLDAASADNLQDAAQFCLRQLQGWVADAADEALAAAGEQLARQAVGNFLVLRLFLHRSSLGARLTLAELRRRAEDLSGVVEDEYRKFFEHLTQRIRVRGKRRLLYTALGALVTAPVPVTVAQVCRTFKLTVDDWDWAFEHLSQFLEASRIRQEGRGELAYRLYHETFRDFLRGRLAPDLPGRHESWARRCLRWRELSGYERLYALRYLPTHLIEASREGGA
jgi:hypothetical protein